MAYGSRLEELTVEIDDIAIFGRGSWGVEYSSWVCCRISTNGHNDDFSSRE